MFASLREVVYSAAAPLRPSMYVENDYDFIAPAPNPPRAPYAPRVPAQRRQPVHTFAQVITPRRPEGHPAVPLTPFQGETIEHHFVDPLPQTHPQNRQQGPERSHFLRAETVSEYGTIQSVPQPPSEHRGTPFYDDGFPNNPPSSPSTSTFQGGGRRPPGGPPPPGGRPEDGWPSDYPGRNPRHREPPRAFHSPPGPPDDGPPDGYDVASHGHLPDDGRPFNVYVERQTGPRVAKAKAREPDRFTGKDPRKIQTFILQCIIFFQNDTDAYPNDAIKINTAVSYFEGLALEWISPFLFHDPKPAMLTDWTTFMKGLHDMFGDRNVPLVAARTLEKLSMKDNHHVQKYMIDFAQWAPLTGYNDIALANLFYNGLPDRLKDRICEHGRPSEFTALRNLALQFDARHWERQNETSQTSRANTATSAPNNTAKDFKPKAQTNTPATPNSSPPEKPKPKIPSNQLNSSGRLTEDEKQRRRDKSLCMYCGSPEHARAVCPLAPPPRPTNTPASEASKSTTTQTRTTTSTNNSRVGRVVISVPADPPALLEAIDEEPEASENP